MMTNTALACGFLLLCAFTTLSCADRQALQNKGALLRNLLGTGYDKTLRPYGTSTGYVLVKTNLYVRSVYNVDPKNHLYSIGLILRQEWNDPRLTFDDNAGSIPYLTLTDISKVWIPDLFISNSLEESFHDVVVPNSYIRISPNGDVLYSVRISVTVAQNRDTLKLPLRLGSYGYTTDDIVLQWREVDPVQISKNIQNSPRLAINVAETSHSNSTTVTGVYSSLTAELSNAITNERLSHEGALELQRQDELLRSLLDNEVYNKKVRPVGTNESQIVVSAELYVVNIKEVEVEVEKQEISIIAYVRQRWNDARLKFDNLEGKIESLVLPDPQEIWKPDLFFANSLKDKIYDVTVPNSFARIYPDGNVLLSYRIGVKFPCTANVTGAEGGNSESLRCALQMESYGYAKKDLVYKWNPKTGSVGHSPDVVRSKYKLVNIEAEASEEEVGTNTYRILKAILNLNKV